ncbi:MAG: TolC family protein [Elusimicrobia bacterium]|nr:TolC family protein [Elusimicrobiota bacterium]
MMVARMSLLLMLAAVPGKAADAPALTMPLAEAEKRALETSSGLESVRLEFEAAKAAALSQRSFLVPELRLEASGRYQSEVSELALPIPGTEPRRLGDNINYSVGPAMQWNVWDMGAARKSWRSFSELAKAKSAEYESARRQSLLAARTAYFQVQLALESLRLLADHLKLASAQHRDIKLGLEAGTKSRIDLLMAHLEMLARKRQFRQARTDLASALRDLFNLTGWGEGLDASLPLDARTKDALPEGAEPPSLIIELDPIDKSAAALAKVALAGPDPSHPTLLSLAGLARSFTLASQGYKAQRWPKLTLSAKTSLDYPNGAELNDFSQNTVGLAASMPLFEWGRSADRAKEGEGRAHAASKRQEQAWKDLGRDWNKSSDQLANLKSQQEINKANVAEASELAGLVYDSYQAGRSTFLEVQSANVRALEAKVIAVRTDVQVLMQLAMLGSLAKQ